MDLIDIVYHISRIKLANEDSNRLDAIIRNSHKEYLYHESFTAIKEELFKILEQYCNDIDTK